MRFLKKYKLLLIFILAGATGAIVLVAAHAQSLSVNANVDWVDGASSCYGSINGQDTSYFNAVKGDNLTFNLTNVSSQYSLALTIQESGQGTFSTTMAPGGKVSTSFPVNSEITVLVDSPNPPNSNPCQSGHGGPGALIVLDAAGSMSCSIQNNQVWNLSFNYTDIANTITLYRGSTLVDTLTGNKNSQFNSPLSFSAQSAAATYYLYNGANNGASLIGQATCPAKTAAASSSTSSGSAKSGTPAAKSTAPTSTAAPASSTPAPAPTPTTASQKAIEQSSVKAHGKEVSPWLYAGLLSVIVLGGIAYWKFAPKYTLKIFSKKKSH